MLNSGKTYQRQLAASERFFVFLNENGLPIVNQFILEGEGHLDRETWQRAVDVASFANPGMRLTLKGTVCFSVWKDTGLSPPVREVDGSDWDGFGPHGADFLYDRLDPFKGPTAEVVLIQGDKPRVLFRSLHGISDGRGLLNWIKDIFLVLNGQSPVGAHSNVTDVRFARQLTKGYRSAFPNEHLSPTGKAEGNACGVAWRRMRLSGKYPKIMPQLCILLAREARSHQAGVVRICLPVDMRIHDRKIRATGNLVGGLTLEIRPDTTIADIDQEILTRIRRKDEAKVYKGADFYRYMPFWMMKAGYGKMMHDRRKSSLYNITAYVSNLNHISMKPFQGGGFKATGFFPIIIFTEHYPCMIGLASHGDAKNGYYQEIIVGMPKIFASNGRFETLFTHLQEGVEDFKNEAKAK